MSNETQNAQNEANAQSENGQHADDAPSVPDNELDAAAKPTPLEQVHAQQAQMQNHEMNDLVGGTVEIPGHSKPSDKRKHPQRQTNYSAD